MLALIVSSKNIYSELHVDDKDNKVNGFSIINGKLGKFDLRSLEVLKLLFLSEDKVKLENRDGCEVYFDNNSKLIHFFKDGVLDLDKFIAYNSKDAYVYLNKEGKNKNKKLRSFKVNDFKFILTVDIILSLFLSGLIVHKTINQHVIVYDGKLYYSKEYVESNILESIAYTFEGREDEYNKPLQIEDIQNYIYSSTNLSNEEKDYLYNSELFQLVYPYYSGTYWEVVVRNRFDGIDIIDFTDEEDKYLDCVGYYAHDNLIHVKEYEEGYDLSNSTVVGHELVHMLQVYNGLSFLDEPSAEIMNHEFFLDSCSSADLYSYSHACKCLKVLMEIIGPEPILDYNFRVGSTAIQDAVKPYFNKSDYDEFISLLKKKSLELDATAYSRLEELLGILYRNKYGQEISEDEMIGSILNNNYYSRAYFRESLIDSELSYYYVSSLETTISLEEAYNKGIARVYHVIEMSEEEYNSYDKNNIPDMAVVSYPKFSYEVKGSSITKNGSKFSGKVLLADGRNLEIDEAILEGHVKIVYRCTLNVSLEEFLANKDNTEYVVYVENGEYNRNDNTCVLDNRNDYIYVPTISEKFNLDRGLRY